MKKEVHPAAIIAIAVVVVIGLGIWLFKAMQPAPYKPSPGVGGTPAATLPNEGKMPKGSQPGHADSGPPPNVTPGNPAGIKN